MTNTNFPLNYKQQISSSAIHSHTIFLVYNNKMNSQSGEQYDKIISHENIIREIDKNDENYISFFEIFLPHQSKRQQSLILNEITESKPKESLFKYLELKSTQKIIQNLINQDETVSDLRQSFKQFQSNKKQSQKYKSFLQLMSRKVNNLSGFTMSNQYNGFLRRASKSHKAKLKEWQLNIQRKRQLLCVCGKEQVNMPGLRSHQNACPSIKRDDHQTKRKLIMKKEKKRKAPKRGLQAQEESDYQP